MSSLVVCSGCSSEEGVQTVQSSTLQLNIPSKKGGITRHFPAHEPLWSCRSQGNIRPDTPADLQSAALARSESPQDDGLDALRDQLMRLRRHCLPMHRICLHL